MVSTLASVPGGWNSADLSPELSALFPAGVIAAQLLQPPAIELLTSQEIASVSQCADRRVRDFAAGRLCARRALEALGVTGFSLLPSLDRQPIWPPGIAGSITHTEGYAAAVVCRHGAVRSLGLDCESISALREEIWPQICAPSELAWLREVLAGERQLCAALIFSAKEAFYKSQFPITSEWIDFEDVVIRPEGLAAGSGEFEVLPQRKLRLQDRMAGPILGRFRQHDGFITAGVALRN